MRPNTGKRLAVALYEELSKYNGTWYSTDINYVSSYFFQGFISCKENDLDTLEYWKVVIKHYPNFIDSFYDKLIEHKCTDEAILHYIGKLAILK